MRCPNCNSTRIVNFKGNLNCKRCEYRNLKVYHSKKEVMKEVENDFVKSELEEEIEVKKELREEQGDG